MEAFSSEGWTLDNVFAGSHVIWNNWFAKLRTIVCTVVTRVWPTFLASTKYLRLGTFPGGGGGGHSGGGGRTYPGGRCGL